MSQALLDVYPRLPITLVKGEGAWVETDTGQRLLDLYGGHAVTPLGHGHPDLRAALLSTHEALDFYSNSVVLPVQERAAKAVLGNSEHLGWAYFVNSGTEANEAALHIARRHTGRARVLSFDCSFHGRSLASLGVTGLAGYRARLSVPANGSAWAPLPFGSWDALDRIDDSVAAVLCESIPSIAGILLPPAGWYEEIERRCRDAGALLIFDEVQGGVGRTGTWFSHQGFGVRPDLVTLAKSLGGGFPVGAVAGTDALRSTLGHGELGTTFGGGPMACASVEAVAQVIARDGLMARTQQIFARFAEATARWPGASLRGKGCLMGLETPRLARDLRNSLLDRNVLVGTSSHPHTIRLLPPYILTDDELDIGIQTIGEALGG